MVFAICNFVTCYTGAQTFPVLVSPCERDVEFLLFSESFNFDDAKQACADHNSTLARISNNDEQSTVVDFMSEFGDGELEFWIGNDLNRVCREVMLITY